MHQPTDTDNTAPVEQAPTAKKVKPAATKRTKSTTGKSTKKTGRKRSSKKKKPTVSTRRLVLLIVLEVLGLTVAAVTGIVVLLGYAAARFSGSQFFSHLLPFTLGVLGLIVVIALLLIGWLRLRRWLGEKKLYLPAVLAVLLALASGVMTVRGDFLFAFSQFRILIGGKEEASRVNLTHQVFAA